MRRTHSLVAVLARKFNGNPTIVGVFLNDEPQTPQMPAIGRVVKILREAIPEYLPFVNLFYWYRQCRNPIVTLPRFFESCTFDRQRPHRHG